MKKFICIFLSVFMLCLVPLHGYASAPVVWGIGEEVILPFLMALLGVQAKSKITTYQELEAYNSDIYSSLTESLAGLAGMEVIQEWIFNVVNGLIQTDSIVWEKLYDIAVSNYVVSASDDSISVDYSGNLGTFNFNYYKLPSYTVHNSRYNTDYVYTSDCVLRTGQSTVLTATSVYADGYRYFYRNGVLESTYVYPASSMSSYTYDGKTVYYGSGSYYWTSYDSFVPDMVISSSSDNAKVAWLMVYGDYSAPSENIGSYSDAFDNVLTASEKDDIVDGSSVIQLYNPATLQNGLEIIPGGDPEEDPNLKKIPFAVTADWWNFLQQFGSDTGNQVVNAYNALNGLDEGTSVGRISDAYDSLGIASVGAAAAQAAEGILNLTDSNIYPQSESVADTITNTIPSSLTPEAPDSGITNESEQGLYKLPDLRDYFPFCIPFDLIDLLGKFVAEPQTPEFAIALSTGYSTSTEEVDLHVVDTIASIVRTFELVGFILALILITRNLIRG